MLLIELFSGTGSVGKVARKMGWNVISVDADPSHGAMYTANILKLDYKSMPVPDFVWASPPCTTYSLAATWFRHRDPSTGKAFTEDARKADEIKHLKAELDTCDGLGGCGRVQGRYERRRFAKKRGKYQ